jgi:predicted alpha-1,2-mannosidase
MKTIKSQRKITILLVLFLMNGIMAQEPVNLVYPHLDAANSRWFFFSSACRPFGMVNLSPDTELGGAWGSGYRYHSEEIKGFSHIHAWQLAGISVMPIPGTELKNRDLKEVVADYYSPFSHEQEEVMPGYHKVILERYKTSVELTSTTRVGFHRYGFPSNEGNSVLFSLGGQLGPVKITDGWIKQVQENSIQGMVMNDKTIRRPKKTPVYFHVQFNRNIRDIQFHQDDMALINLEDGDTILMKVGISYVSPEQASLNMTKELDHWDFEKVKKDSFREWNQLLGKIMIEDDNEEAVRRFYTDLWHALQGRRIISDVNGKYADMTGKEPRIGQIALNKNGNPKFNHHNSDSFWGAQWTLNTLWHLAYPKISSDFCNSLLCYYKDGGIIPRGPSGGNYTYVMTGASSTPFIVSAYQKGIRGFDVELAYEGLKKNHMPGGIMDHSGYEHLLTKSGGVKPYIKKGYVPYPYKPHAIAFHKEGAGQTLEYAYQDWTLAQLAQELGNTKDYKYFLERSENYRHLYDVSTGYMRPRQKDGSWLKNFDPGAYKNGFVESNSFQSSWFVPHDIKGLAGLMGGKEQLIEKLNAQFEAASVWGFTSGKKHADETNEELARIPINYGNQPSIQTAYIFHEVGAPWLSQRWARAVVDSVYSGLSPDFGYNGDEDQGLMGSLAVLMKIGLFQLNGGTEKDPVYQIGSPIFDKITIHLSEQYYSGKDFIIETINNSPENIYVQSASLNSIQLDKLYLRHSEIISGGHLILEMGPEPQQ